MIRSAMLVMISVTATAMDVQVRFEGVVSKVPDANLYLVVRDRVYPLDQVTSSNRIDAVYSASVAQDIPASGTFAVLLTEPVLVTLSNGDNAIFEPYLYQRLKPIQGNHSQWTINPQEHPNRVYLIRDDPRGPQRDQHEKVLYYMTDEFLAMYAISDESTEDAAAIVSRDTKIRIAQLRMQKMAGNDNLSIYNGPWPTTCVVVGNYDTRSKYFWHTGFWGRRLKPICVPIRSYQQFRDLVTGGMGGLPGSATNEQGRVLAPSR